MFALARLCKNGNGSMVTIPKAMLRHLGWLPGEYIAVVVGENMEVTCRRVTADQLLGKPQPTEQPQAAQLPGL